jgi:hypothetical protein
VDEPEHTERRQEHRAHDERSSDSRRRTVGVLERNDDVVGDSVAGDGDDQQRDAERFSGGTDHVGDAHGADPGQPDDQSDHLTVPGCPPQQQDRDDQHGQGSRCVDHSRHRGLHVLLGDREEERRPGVSGDGYDGDSGPWVAVNGLPCRWEAPQGGGTDRHPQERDRERIERVESDVGPQERGTPDGRNGNGQCPVTGIERARVGAVHRAQRSPPQSHHGEGR